MGLTFLAILAGPWSEKIFKGLNAALNTSTGEAPLVTYFDPTAAGFKGGDAKIMPSLLFWGAGHLRLLLRGFGAADLARPRSRPPAPSGWPAGASACCCSRWTRRPASRIFQQDIFGREPVKIMDNLWAHEVDADRRIRDYQAEIRRKILDMYGFDKVPEEIDKLHRRRLGRAGHRGERDLRRGGGHHRAGRLRLLHLRPGAAGPRALLPRHGQGLRRLGELTYITERINASSRILTDAKRTAFFFVVVPEEMIILDTTKTVALFARFDVPISGYVVNRVLPATERRRRSFGSAGGGRPLPPIPPRRTDHDLCLAVLAVYARALLAFRRRHGAR